MAGPQVHPMRALALHQLRADTPGLLGQALIVAVAGGMLSLVFSVLRLSRSGVGMPETSQALATNAVLWIIVSCLVILPQVGRFGIDRRRYDYACWTIAGMPFARTVAVIGLGVALSLFAGMLGGVLFALVAAPLLGRAPIVLQDAPVFVPGVSLAPAATDYVTAFGIVAGLLCVSGLLGARRIARTPPRLALADVERAPRRPLVRRVLGSSHVWLVLACVSVAFGWLVAGEQSGLFVSVGAILALVWAGGAVRAGWIRQVQRLVIGSLPRRPLAFSSSGLATESVRLDPMVLFPVLFAMGAPAIIVTVVKAETVALRSTSTMTLMDITLLFFGPIVLAVVTAVVGLWLGAVSLGRTMEFLGVLGLPRRSCLTAAAISQLYLATLSLLLVVASCLLAAVTQALIVGARSVPDLVAVLLQSPPYGYLGVVFLAVAIPSALIAAAAHAVRTPSDNTALTVS